MPIRCAEAISRTEPHSFREDHLPLTFAGHLDDALFTFMKRKIETIFAGNQEFDNFFPPEVHGECIQKDALNPAPGLIVFLNAETLEPAYFMPSGRTIADYNLIEVYEILKDKDAYKKRLEMDSFGQSCADCELPVKKDSRRVEDHYGIINTSFLDSVYRMIMGCGRARRLELLESFPTDFSSEWFYSRVSAQIQKDRPHDNLTAILIAVMLCQQVKKEGGVDMARIYLEKLHKALEADIVLSPELMNNMYRRFAENSPVLDVPENIFYFGK